MSEVCAQIPYKVYPFMVPILHSPKRFLGIEAHRRCSKTMFACAWLMLNLLSSKDWHPRGAFVGPTLENAVNSAWDYLTHFASFIPGSKVNVSRREIHFINGGKIKLYGATDPDKVKGTYMDFVVSDESAQHPPKMWQEVLRPMLNDRGRSPGKALFIGTTKGKSFFWQLMQRGASEPDWATWRFKASQTGIFSQQQLQEFRREMGDALYNQEFELDPNASIVGAYLGAEMKLAWEQGRIGIVPYDPRYEVFACFDLGAGINQVIWFAQATPSSVNLLDYHEGNQGGIPGTANFIRSKPFACHRIILPHDGINRESGSNLSRENQWRAQNFTVDTLKKQSISSRIDAARAFVSRCRFNAATTQIGIDHLTYFKVKYDERIGLASVHPDKSGGHDHAFDAFSHMALGLPENAGRYTFNERAQFRAQNTRAIMDTNY